VIQTFT